MKPSHPIRSAFRAAGCAALLMAAIAMSIAVAQAQVPAGDGMSQPQQLLLRFQLIEATNTAAPRDPAIAEVDTVLRDLFRFNGYKLLSQAVITTSLSSQRGKGVGSSSGTSTQLLSGGPGKTYELTATVEHSWGPAAGQESMRIGVWLHDVTRPDSTTQRSYPRQTLLKAEVSIAPGRTVVIGSTQPSGPGSALILAVRPQIR